MPNRYHKSNPKETAKVKGVPQFPTREICLEEHLQLAYMAVFNEVTRGHWHVLMLGRNRLGKSLKDVSREKWEERWKDNALIREIYDLVGVSRYFSHNLVLENSDLSGVFSYNRKLLNKSKPFYPGKGFVDAVGDYRNRPQTI